ncbi:MAG: hypothetical protein ACK56K_16345 [Akkermansiaceae bacterium]|jgi:hypothetical protein|nr:hypothetical protein [Luteolibacter sp.]
MSDLRERLIAAGWRQGVILEPTSLQQAGITVIDDAIGFLALTQTCDCINPDFVKEPHLELLPLVPRNTKKGKPDPNYQNGINPREIHFWITLRGDQKCVVSQIKDIQLVKRDRIEEFRFSEDIGISKEEIDDIIEWRAARYSRTAFPETFETAFQTIKESFSEIIASHETNIESLLIEITPFSEIQHDDCYEIQMHLMVKLVVLGQPDTIVSLKKAAKQIEELFTTCVAFASAKCTVTSLNQMTLWERRSLLDFSRYDYLSFGKEDASPGGATFYL